MPITIEKLPIEKISQHPKNPKLFRERDTEYIKSLAQDIRKVGLQDKIILNRNYQILSGWNRFLAVTTELGWKDLSPTDYEIRTFENVKEEVSFLIRRNVFQSHLVYRDRLRIYRTEYPDILSARVITAKRLEEIHLHSGIAIPTIKKDLIRLRRGEAKNDSIDFLKEKWKEKGYDVKVNLVDQGQTFILIVQSKNLRFEYGPNRFIKVLREAHAAADSKYFLKVEKKAENISFGSQIRKLRKKAKLTQTCLAKKLHISQSFLSEIEAGLYNCSREVLDQAINVCGVENL